MPIGAGMARCLCSERDFAGVRGRMVSLPLTLRLMALLVGSGEAGQDVPRALA